MSIEKAWVVAGFVGGLVAMVPKVIVFLLFKWTRLCPYCARFVPGKPDVLGDYLQVGPPDTPEGAKGRALREARWAAQRRAGIVQRLALKTMEADPKIDPEAALKRAADFVRELERNDATRAVFEDDAGPYIGGPGDVELSR